MCISNMTNVQARILKLLFWGRGGGGGEELYTATHGHDTILYQPR
jgi:hypothetical protein